MDRKQLSDYWNNGYNTEKGIRETEKVQLRMAKII